MANALAKSDSDSSHSTGNKWCDTYQSDDFIASPVDPQPELLPPIHNMRRKSGATPALVSPR